MTLFKNYLITFSILCSATLFARLIEPHFDATNIVMVHMLAVVIVAFFLNLGAAIISCLVSVVLFDFFNLPPYMQVSRAPTEYTLTLLVMLTTAITISSLATRLRQQAIESEQKEARTLSLYKLSEELAQQLLNESVINITVKHIGEAFNAHIRVLYQAQTFMLEDTIFSIQALAQAFSGQIVRQENRTEAHICLPLAINTEVYALIIVSCHKDKLQSRSQNTHLQAMLKQASLAMERNKLRQQIQESELRVQQELLRNNLLNAISHDLRTPLASIIGASSSLLNEGQSFSEDSRLQLRTVIYQEALHMQGMVENLLDMAKLQSGVKLSQEWQAIEEIVGSALVILRRRIKQHSLEVAVPDDLPLLRCDSILMERVIINLVENAAKYSPPASLILLSARLENENTIVLNVIDQGQGIPDDLKERIFEPFYQVNATSTGFGLGLTICRAIVEAHGGTIRFNSHEHQGTTVSIYMPIFEQAPVLKQETL